jgi:hypothetical protein
MVPGVEPGARTARMQLSSNGGVNRNNAEGRPVYRWTTLGLECRSNCLTCVYFRDGLSQGTKVKVKKKEKREKKKEKTSVVERRSPIQAATGTGAASLRTRTKKESGAR